MHSKKILIIVLAGLAGSLSACEPSTSKTGTSSDVDVSFVELGRAIVQTRCAVCHNTGASGDSPRADAPPLRTVLSTNNPSALADDFRERIHVGHPDMPDFNFSVKEVDGLLAYLNTIQENP